MGGYERHPAPWSLDGIPGDFNGKLLAPDWPRFAEIMDGAVRRVPAIADAGINRMINGPEAFTPDNEFILGESDVRGFFVAAGFCAHGIAGAGGIGRQVASWIVDGEPELDLWKMDIRRFGPAYRSRDYTLARTTEVYATYYDIHYPNEERQAGRPLRTSPTYDVLAGLGAVFGEKSGWERPNWFESNAADGDEALRPRGWAGMHWSPAIGAEALATRRAAGLFDETSFAKIEVVGPGAVAFLGQSVRERGGRAGRPDRVHAAAQPPRRHRVRPDRHPGRRRSLPARSPARRSAGTTSAGFGATCPATGACCSTTSRPAASAYALWGPRARDILGLAHARRRLRCRPSRTSPRAPSPSVPCLCTRCGSPTWASSAGSCTPTPNSALRSGGRSGKPVGRTGWSPAGYRAIDALRLEKGYRVWSSDITPDETPVRGGPRVRGRARQAGTAFIGRDALVAAKAAGPRKRLRCLVLDDPRSVCLGNEPVRVGGEIVGRVTSGRLRVRGRAFDRLRLSAAGRGDRDARGG